MTAVLHGQQGKPVTIMYSSPWFEKATTNGGIGGLPGDADTEDLAENEAKRIEAAKSMPFERARNNLLRSGHSGDFATRYLRALMGGGETSATSLDLAVTKTFTGRTDEVVVDSAKLPDRWFREAWRRTGDGVVIEPVAAKEIFAAKLIAARGGKMKGLTAEIEKAYLLDRPADRLEAQYQILQNINLRQLGAKIMKAATAKELRELWPDELPLLPVAA